jgi:monoamine oxidase
VIGLARERWVLISVMVENLPNPPAGAAHFDGERTADEWAGLMEGAMRSGERAAAATRLVMRP